MSYLLLYLQLCGLFFCSALFAEDPVIISLRGYLGRQELQQAEQKIRAANSSEIFLEIDSDNGDLLKALDLAKELYLYKTKGNTTIVAYIDGNALGPAAVFPFIADSIYVSSFASWGDIPSGNEEILTPNILRSQVLSLVQGTTEKDDLLRLLAASMSDKAFSLSDKSKELEFLHNQPNETLVLNQQQLKTLNIIKAIVPLAEFRSANKLSNSDLKEPSSEKKQVVKRSLAKKNVAKEIAAHIVEDPSKPLQVGYIAIDDISSSITQATWLYVKNALESYKKLKPAFIILELNTPGGEVFAAQKISDALKDFDTQYNIPIVCFINNWAISAGAMLAYSCRFIAVVKDASMGAAEPVIMGEDNKMMSASEKINSALRADFASRARFYDRNPYIAEAMVDKDILLVSRHGEIIKLDNDSQIRTTGTDPDIVLSPKGKLLTLNAEQLIEFSVAEVFLPPKKTESITDAERSQGHWPAEKMLLFSSPDFEKFSKATVIPYQMDWKSRFFAFLAQPMVSSLLLLGVMMGFYMEFSTPGFGVPGAIGVISLILIMLSSYALEIASWLEILLILIGVCIILVDIFILPSFGLLSFFGIVCFLAGLFGLLIPGLESVDYEFDTQTFNAAGEVVLNRILWFSGTIVLCFILMILLARYVMPSLGRFSKFVLTGNEQDASKGYFAGEDPEKMPASGSIGQVFADLRPSGKVIIDGKIWEAISYSAFIEKGKDVVVVGFEGSGLIVKSINKLPVSE